MIQNRNSYNNLQYKIQGNELIPIKKELEKLDDRVSNLEECCEELHDEVVTEKVITDCLQVNGNAYIGNIESEGTHCARIFCGNEGVITDITSGNITVSCCAQIKDAHIEKAVIDNLTFEDETVDDITINCHLQVNGTACFENKINGSITCADNATAADDAYHSAVADEASLAHCSVNSTCFAGCDEQEWHDYIAGQIPTCAADSAKFAGCTCDEWKDIIKTTCVDNAACATNANDSICFSGKDETCWKDIIKTTCVDNAACATNANDSVCFDGKTFACACADILSGTANNATCFNGKDETCWCNIIKETKVDNACCADSATNSTCFNGCTYACAKDDILSGTANNATCFDGKTSACWCSIIKGTKVDEASHADVACDIDNAPELCACNKCINVTVGTKTSNNFTVPYSTCAELVCIDSVNDNANLQIPLVGTQTPYTQLHRDNNSGILFNPGCNTLCVCNAEVKTSLTSCCGTFTNDLCSCGELNVNGNANIGGDLSVAGTICCIHTEEIDTSCDNIHLRYDATTAISPGCYSGLVITKYDGTNNLEVGVDCEGTLKIGTDPSNMEAVETRDCSACMEDGYVEKWDSADKKACTKGTSCTHDLCVNGNATATGNITATCFCGKATSADNADNATTAGSACYADKMATHYITGNQDMYPTFTYCYTSQTCQEIATDKDIKYNPSTNTFTVPTVCATSCICGNLKGNVCGDVTGNLTGNADTATNSTCFGGKTEACWCSIIKGTKVDCACCADNATDSTCFNGCTYACAKADILGGKAACACCADSATTAGSSASSTDSTCFAGKNETCWCNIIKSTCVDNANYATSAGSATTAGSAASSTDSTCFAGKNETCWCNIIKSTCVYNANYATSAGSATNASNVIPIAASANEEKNIAFFNSTVACGTADTVQFDCDKKITYNPSTNTLTVPNSKTCYGTTCVSVIQGSANGAALRFCSPSCAYYACFCLSSNSHQLGVCVGGTQVGCWTTGGYCGTVSCAVSATSAGSATTATCVTLNAYDNCGTKSLIVGGTNELGTVSCLTYNTCTCTMYNKGAEFGEYQLTIPSPNGVCRYVLVDLCASQAPNVKAQVHTSSYNINKSDSSTYVYGDSDYGIIGYAHLGTGETPSSCLWLKVTGWRAFRFSGSYKMSVVCNTTTDPGCTWVAPKILASKTDLVCCACTVCRTACHNDYNYHLALFGGNTSVSCAGLYTADTCPLTFNPAIGVLSSVNIRAGGLSAPNIYGVFGSYISPSTCYPVCIHARCTNATCALTDYAFGFHSNGCMTAGTVYSTAFQNAPVTLGHTPTSASSFWVNIGTVAPTLCMSTQSLEIMVGGVGAVDTTCVDLYISDNVCPSVFVRHPTRYISGGGLYCLCLTTSGSAWNCPVTLWGLVKPFQANCSLSIRLYKKNVNNWTDCMKVASGTPTGTGVYCDDIRNNYNVMSASLAVGCPVSCTSSVVGRPGSFITPGTISLGSTSTPFIDFDVNNACDDYSHRIIANCGCLQVIATNATGCTAATCTASFYFKCNGTLSANKLTLDNTCAVTQGVYLKVGTSYTNADKNILITPAVPGDCSTAIGELQASSCCPLTFNPATGDLCARAFCGCVHATGEIDCAKCITRMQATTGTCHLAMFSGKTCIADARAYVSNGCELTYQPATGTLTAPIFCGSLCGTATNSTCFNGCTYAQACSAIRSGLISDIGVCVYCGTTCKCSLTKSSSLCLSANAFNANATISTTTYPGACCTGTLTEKCTVFGNVRVVEQGSIAFICSACSFVGCDMYKALCCVVGSNSVMYVNGYMPSLGNVCQLRCLSSTCYSIDGTSQTQQFTSTQTGIVTQRHTMITIMK